MGRQIYKWYQTHAGHIVVPLHADKRSVLVPDLLQRSCDFPTEHTMVPQCVSHKRPCLLNTVHHLAILVAHIF